MELNTFIVGAIAMASLVAALFFFQFWRETKDRFFLFFALAFGLDAMTRLVLSLDAIPSEQDPIIYLGRLVTYGLILVAIIRKNQSRSDR